MLKGVPLVPPLEWSIPSLLCLCLLAHLGRAAPGVPGAQRAETFAVLANPLGAGEEDRRLLQSYIQANVKDGQGPEISTWETAVYFLLRLYDFDRSGHMDGLEMMKLLSDYNSHKPPGTETNEPVVSMVDFLLQTKDLNQDGLLALSELLSPPLPHTQDSNNKHPQQEHERAAKEKLPTSEESLKMGEGEQPEEEYKERTLQEEVRHTEDVSPDHVLEVQEEDNKRDDDLNGLQIPEAQQVWMEDDHKKQLVHQGQPEM